MKQRSLTLLVWLTSALAAACNGDNAVGLKFVVPEPPLEPPLEVVLARVEVTPDSSFLMLGDVDQLTIDAWDQFGARLLHDPDGEWAGEATYVSSDPAVVRVVGGLLTGLTPGVARITVSLTIADSTLTDSMTVQVSNLPNASGTVLRMSQYGRWGPIEVSLKAPATVSWVIPDGVRPPQISLWSDGYGGY